MTPKFKNAVTVILRHEGGYINHPSDPGGETKYGISKRAYPELDIKNLTKEDAEMLYYADYWQPLKCEALPTGIALVLFDMGVNMGNRAAVKCIQRAVMVKDDGVIGPMTRAAVSAHDKADVIEKLTQERLWHYAQLGTFKTFGRGWIRRSLETMSTALLIRDYL